MNVLDKYLQSNGTTRYNMSKVTQIPETTLSNLAKKEFEKWTMAQIAAIGKTVGKDSFTVIKEIQVLRAEGDKTW